MFKEIQDKDLVDCYVNALQLKLDTDFLSMLLHAIEQRNLQLPDEAPPAM